MSKINQLKPKPFLVSLAIPLVVGAISGFLTKSSIQQYSTLIKPSISPPAYVFPIVWTLLFVLMGISSYLIYISDSTEKYKALFLYAVQLVFNFLWSILFFNLQLRLVAFVWILMLIYLIILMIQNFYKISPLAAYLQIPYLLWCIFAAYLNLMIIILNK